jgi:hypothetical protein
MAGPRSRRRPIVFVLAALTVTAIVLIAQGGASSRPKASEAVQAYLDQLRPGVQASTTDGSDFIDIRTNAATLGKAGIDRRLDRLGHSVNTTLTSIDTLTPPASMRVAQAYLVAALGARAKALVAARPAMDAALTMSDTPDQGVQAAAAALGAVGQDLQFGDLAFTWFSEALPSTVAAPPPSTWINNPTDWTSVELTAFVTVLRSASTVTPVHDLAMVAYQTDPQAVSTLNGAEVIPATKNMGVSMVVENVGNQTEHNVTITAVLALSDNTQQSLRDFIDLAPGQRRAITLLSMHPTAGSSGTLTLTVQPVPGETNVANNTLNTPVAFK